MAANAAAKPAGDEAESSENAGRRANDQALAVSVPDNGHMLMRMITSLLGVQKMQFFTVPAAFVIIAMWTLSIFGVPALLAGQTLFMQIHSDNVKLDLSDRDIQRQQATATQELLSAVRGVANKLDEQGNAIQGQGQQLDKLSSDVAGVKADQADATRRLNALATQQQMMQTKLDQRR